jgi:hypothetical protein
MTSYIEFNEFNEFVEFIEFIKNIKDKYDCILKYFEKNNKFLQLSMSELDGLYFIKPDIISSNLSHSDKFINYILHNIDYIIFDLAFDLIYFKKKKIKIDKSHTILHEIKTKWNSVKVYNYDIGFETTLVYYNEKYYYVNNFNLQKTTKHIDILIEKSDINFKQNIFTDIIISSKSISHILYYKHNILHDTIYLLNSELLHYSCIDELLFDLENISLLNEHKKKITTGGFILKYNSKEFILNTYIYQKVKDIIPSYENINKCYIELYKNDNLGFIINYMSPYPADIIKRINSTFKTLSREFLNIYHVTRKKANSELYNVLSNNYKTILFDLHKIFIYTRKNEEPKTLCNIMNSDEEFYEKKSLNHDITYKYMKKISTEQISNILIERINLIEDINNIQIDMNNIKMNTNEFKILFNDCIHTKTMSYLLKIKY